MSFHRSFVVVAMLVAPLVSFAASAPDAPTIDVPAIAAPLANVSVAMRSVDADGSGLRYEIDWDFDGLPDAMEPFFGYVSSGETRIVSKSWDTGGVITFAIRARDTDGLAGTWTTASITILANQAPGTPVVTAPISAAIPGVVGTEYSFSVRAIDPDGGILTYAIDWDGNGSFDGSVSGSSGVSVGARHTWTIPGAYMVRVRAQDSIGASSPDAVLLILIGAANSPSISVSASSSVVPHAGTFRVTMNANNVSSCTYTRITNGVVDWSDQPIPADLGGPLGFDSGSLSWPGPFRYRWEFRCVSGGGGAADGFAEVQVLAPTAPIIRVSGPSDFGTVELGGVGNTRILTVENIGAPSSALSGSVSSASGDFVCASGCSYSGLVPGGLPHEVTMRFLPRPPAGGKVGVLTFSGGGGTTKDVFGVVTDTTTTIPPTTEPPSTTEPPTTSEPPTTTEPPTSTPPPGSEPPGTSEPPTTTEPPATSEPPSSSPPPTGSIVGSLDFGNVVVSRTKTLSLTVTNNSGGRRTGTLSSGAPFTCVGGCSYDIPIGGVHTFTVRFWPIMTGPASSIGVFSDYPGAVIGLSGTGVPPFWTTRER